MAEETLLSAARRVVRFIGIDEAHGGCVQIETLMAVETLRKQIAHAELEDALAAQAAAGIERAAREPA